MDMESEEKKGYVHPPQTTPTQHGSAGPLQCPPGPTIVIQPMYEEHPGNRISENYLARPSVVLGVVHIVAGLLLIGLNVAAIYLEAFVASIGYGMWSGAWFVLTGAFGVGSGKSRITCVIVTFMILSILASLVTAISLSFSAFASWCDAAHCLTAMGTTSKSSRVSIDVAMCIVLGIGGILAVVSSTLCCRAACCAGRSQRGNQEVMLKQT